MTFSMMQLPFYSNIEEVRQAARGCRACRRSEQRSQVVFGAGDPNASLMLVAEYPSQTDDRTGVPFTGPAGDFLDELLEECGVTRDRIWITNVVRCYATETGRAGDRIRGATQRERTACKIWMDLELQFVDPSVILAVGAPAAASLIAPEFQLTDQRGSWHQRDDGRWAIATLQPAYLLRMRTYDPDAFPHLRSLVLSDIEAAVTRAGLKT
jgi:uracil-DNA glycosylase